MKDSFGREITYLRLSVTELCNLRCQYCMPAEGIEKKCHMDMLTQEEMVTAVQAAASLGIYKLRITGGEPLVKKNILSLCRHVSAVEGIREVAITTNGTLLPPLAKPLCQAGVGRVNLSLDTLNEEKYRRITRTGELSQALAGLEAALDAGFTKVKINAVLIGGFNDEEIPALAELTKRYPVDVRFIELMPMAAGAFGPQAYVPGYRVLQKLPQLQPIAQEGVAQLYRLPEGQGNVGLISPLSREFCPACNRLRLTADGKLKPCLHSGQEFSLKGMSFAAMRRVMTQAILAKPANHGRLDSAHPSKSGRAMHQIGG